MVMKNKVLSKSTPSWIKGGSGSMIGKQSVGTKTPGVTGKVDSNGGGKFIKGGSGKMIGKQSASAMKPGKTGK